jgi:peptide/nickel transport system permease protein
VIGPEAGLKALSDDELGNVDIDEPTSGSTFGRYVTVKAAGSAISLLIVILLGFFVFRILPGNPVAEMTHGRRVSPAQIIQLRHQLGLDQPWYLQFFTYAKGLIDGKLGTSFTYDQSVSSLIGQFVVPTLLLTGTAAVISLALGLWLGQKSAWLRGRPFDRIHTAVAIVLWSAPTFWLGLILLLLFAGTFQIFPSGGMTTVGAGYTGVRAVLDVADHMVLPVTTLVAVSYAQYLLVMRAALLEEMSSDYLTTARAKGLRDTIVRRYHAVPNALLPAVTLIFLQLGGLIAGAVTVETVFSWPGLGYLTYQALNGPDMPLLQGTFVVFSGIIIATNFLADIAYRFLDPRVRAA